MRRIILAALLLAGLLSSAHAQFNGCQAGFCNPSAGAGPSGPITFTYQSTALGSSSGNNYTFGTITIGAAANANRRVTVVMTGLGYGGGNPTSGLFTPSAGGTVACDVVSTAGVDALNEGYTLVSAVLPLGTTTTLTVTFPGAQSQSPRFSVYTSDNTTYAAPTSPATNFVSQNPTPASTTVNTTSGGGLLGLSGGASGLGTWTAGISSSDGSFGNFNFGKINNTGTNTPLTVSSSWGAAGNWNSIAVWAFH